MHPDAVNAVVTRSVDSMMGSLTGPIIPPFAIAGYPP
jgi:hypothetical protein